MNNGPRIRWWCTPSFGGVIFHLNVVGKPVGHGYTQVRWDIVPTVEALPLIFHGMVKKLIRNWPSAAQFLRPFTERANSGWRIGKIPRTLDHLKAGQKVTADDKLGKVTNVAAFLEYARREHCNTALCLYPESFRTFRYDRTQHMLEGWEAHADTVHQPLPTEIEELIQDLTMSREDIEHLQESYEGDGLGAVLVTLDRAIGVLQNVRVAEVVRRLKETFPLMHQTLPLTPFDQHQDQVLQVKQVDMGLLDQTQLDYLRRRTAGTGFSELREVIHGARTGRGKDE
jgi:hypothetical protein